MSIFNHLIYDNVRTRVIVTHEGSMLLLPPRDSSSGWLLPGGGLEPKESLADCAMREVWEETGLDVQIHSVAFLREWVVPTYCQLPDAPDGVGYGLEVYLYATPQRTPPTPRPEWPTESAPCWVNFADIPRLPLWPKELKALAASFAAGELVVGVPSFVSRLEHPLADPQPITWNPPAPLVHPDAP